MCTRRKMYQHPGRLQCLYLMWLFLDSDECAKTPCAHGGKCINIQGGFLCDCTSRSRCLYLMWFIFRFWWVCQDAMCPRRKMYQHPGRLPVWMSSVSLVSLFSDSDECAKTPCAHGGKCINIQGGFLCDCTPGWQGRTCEDSAYLFTNTLLRIVDVFPKTFSKMKK